MEPTNSASKYDIFLGNVVDGALLDKKIAGFALLFEGNRYYVMRLMMFPHTWYFLSKNKDSQTHYTVFAKCLRSKDTVRFQDPVGLAILSDDLKTHLEVYFPILDTTVYMSLFPTQSK